MQALDYAIAAVWLLPLVYLCVLLVGKWSTVRRKNNLIRRRGPDQKKVSKIIFQIPTVGNVLSVNRAFETVKSYDLSVPVETWVVVEEGDMHKDQYNCDRLVVVPNDFECEDLYKARALEYARRVRLGMFASGELDSNYLLLQGDDDAVPSLGFIEESMEVNADITIGSITPRVSGIWNTIIDYERCIACGIFCNFFTNMGQPLWAHGEGTVMSSRVDQNVSYDVSGFVKPTKAKLISSEDTFYFHKAATLGYSIFNSEKQIFILPPLSLRDAVKQRRRWVWSQWVLLNQKMLPLHGRITLGVLSFAALWLYFIGMLGLPLLYVGVFQVTPLLLGLVICSLMLWLGMRAYIIGESMGWKQGIIGALLSYVTVALNASLYIIGLLKGDPHNFEVIRKE